MKKIVFKLIMFLLLVTNISLSKIKIGVSMLPYYSFASNIVGNRADIVQILPADVDVHSYQPSPDEVKKISGLDVLIINGTGIDNYMYSLVKASNNKKLVIINANKNVSLLPIAGERGNTKSVNTHTFIAIQAAIQQVNTIAKELSKIDIKNGSYYLKNARSYNKKLSNIKSKKIKEISELRKGINLTVATTHGGYDYILGELGIKVGVVIEPKNHGNLSASDLRTSIDLIKENKIDILFESDGSASPYTKALQKETGVIVEKLLHMTNGKYTKEAFEKDIEKNIDIIINALRKVKQK
ncbi:metal ABC transporter solute-binding protein, Zn/Mn family [Streptobacillus moniliformis]|uniref:metal ABC transporter solute-binding protein, Zn/Mn family n=1 Tax=Streptobacillus moniliformis TaxID=34105 RepID=UPI0007E4354B|nr:zinc ABC transporter substrate-binding protein [Streptobacillus moniliformis]